jgi:hypothetical protein
MNASENYVSFPFFALARVADDVRDGDLPLVAALTLCFVLDLLLRVTRAGSAT